MASNITNNDFERYQRQLALPEIGPAQQSRLKQAHIIMVGAGGLGSTALPYLAAAGVGEITIIDHDTVSLPNLHRQTIFKQDDIGKNKAECAAAYLKALNPSCVVNPVTKKLACDFPINESAGVFLDGSDNFETKSLLNRLSIETGLPLISASVNQWQGQVGIFAGHYKEKPCYHCLFPDLPDDARNCNEAGILGSSAGLTGLYQAHMTLGFLMGLDYANIGDILSFDFKTMRVQNLRLKKDLSCNHCSNANEKWKEDTMNDTPIELVHPNDLQGDDVVIVDVRTDAEVQASPIEGALHIELSTIPARFEELPKDKRLAFACAGNVRSAQAASFVQAMGYDNICIYDALAA